MNAIKIAEFINNDADQRQIDIIAEALSGRGTYVIVAKNLNEQERIEKFIEELKTNPYAP